ncbi:MAG TPA: RNA polymerase sigma factor [Streptosporangiaceae bacterium]|nr:RNA polymerase sigma factor [Streptosporangiaceae bacterium]
MNPDKERVRREVDEFFDDLQGELLGFLLNMGLEPGDAEDVLNDSFLVILRCWPRIRDTNPRAFLYAVARNTVRKLMSTRRRRPESHTDDPAALANTAPAVIAVDFAQQIVDRQTMRWALQKLSEREREAVLLRYYIGYSLAETAQIMGVTTGTVKGHAAAGLKKLGRALGGGDSATGRKEGTR